MAISSCPESGPIRVPENSTREREYIVNLSVTVRAEAELAAADRVADLGRRLTEDCEIADWSLQSIERIEKGAVR